ncbi:MAG: hypothetical protein JJ971_14180 [Balneolaceae bacterium]|nr:hypothetical protein [Balneolaceae bacterium]MBO6547549.1 hypothetical protein [Balneolaceae bacterium]MBO6648061.1 hypothetical protein [Balneolaceae bacterium]
MDRPEVEPGDWVIINQGSIHSYKAVICSIDFINKGCVEVVFLEFKDMAWKKEPSERKAMQTCLFWEEGAWKVDPNFYKGYADNFSRLSEFVTQLRKGEYRD